MLNGQQSISLRPANATDQDFLLAVFASTRSDELAALAANPTQAQLFVEMQFRIQQQSYHTCYPSADNQIILARECPVGRMLVDRTGNALVLVDIALLNDHRNQGIGSLLIQQLMNEAAGLQKPLRLSVYKFNPARRLYERLGFSTVKEENLYIQMQWSPDSASFNGRKDCFSGENNE
jgi:ribosomal protein S18 acetylase RimI-like enzyme